jgi:hypothetical protein
MKKLFPLLTLLVALLPDLNAQTILLEDFETGSANAIITFQSAGTFNSPPGIKNNTNFGSSKVFGFGSSTCGSSCFSSYKTTLIITFPNPTFVNSIMWKEMEINGNWGSQGIVLLDNNILVDATIGALPVNSYTPDASPRYRDFAINMIVTTIKLEVSDITSSSEIIIDDLQVKTSPKIAGYEYWYNDNYANKTVTPVALTQQLTINQTIPTTGLPNGINILNFRSYDNLGQYSSVMSHFFYKTSASESTLNPKIVAYQYWIDNDYANAVEVSTPVNQQVIINELISMNSLSLGIHNFNIRFKDENKVWSSVMSHLFYKQAEQIVGQNLITEYRYWLNDDFNQAINVKLSEPVAMLNLISNLDLTHIPSGLHTIHFQFKDAFDMWSVATADSFEKTITVNIIDNTFSSNILVYPNPTNGKVFVDFGETLNSVTVSIRTIDGKLVQQTKYNDRRTLDFIFNEPPGVYLMTISSENKRTSVRLIKN